MLNADHRPLADGERFRSMAVEVARFGVCGAERRHQIGQILGGRGLPKRGHDDGFLEVEMPQVQPLEPPKLAVERKLAPHARLRAEPRGRTPDVGETASDFSVFEAHPCREVRQMAIQQREDEFVLMGAVRLQLIHQTVELILHVLDVAPVRDIERAKPRGGQTHQGSQGLMWKGEEVYIHYGNKPT